MWPNLLTPSFFLSQPAQQLLNVFLLQGSRPCKIINNILLHLLKELRKISIEKEEDLKPGKDFQWRAVQRDFPKQRTFHPSPNMKMNCASCLWQVHIFVSLAKNPTPPPNNKTKHQKTPVSAGSQAVWKGAEVPNYFSFQKERRVFLAEWVQAHVFIHALGVFTFEI